MAERDMRSPFKKAVSRTKDEIDKMDESMAPKGLMSTKASSLPAVTVEDVSKRKQGIKKKAKGVYTQF